MLEHFVCSLTRGVLSTRLVISLYLSLLPILILRVPGVYQTFYEQYLLSTESSSRITWIGSLQAFLFVFGGVIAGPLYDYGYLQSLVRVGSFLVVFGMMMTSLCHSYWQVILAQGIVIGLGNGALFVPSIALLPTYFSKRRALSTGIAITGGNLGIFFALGFLNQ